MGYIAPIPINATSLGMYAAISLAVPSCSRPAHAARLLQSHAAAPRPRSTAAVWIASLRAVFDLPRAELRPPLWRLPWAAVAGSNRSLSVLLRCSGAGGALKMRPATARTASLPRRWTSSRGPARPVGATAVCCAGCLPTSPRRPEVGAPAGLRRHGLAIDRRSAGALRGTGCAKAERGDLPVQPTWRN